MLQNVSRNHVISFSLLIRRREAAPTAMDHSRRAGLSSVSTFSLIMTRCACLGNRALKGSPMIWALQRQASAYLAGLCTMEHSQKSVSEAVKGNVVER